MFKMREEGVVRLVDSSSGDVKRELVGLKLGTDLMASGGSEACRAPSLADNLAFAG